MNRLNPGIPLPAIDGPWRVDSYGAKIVPARNGKGVEELRLFDHRAFAIYGPFEDESLRVMVDSCIGQLQRQSQSAIPLAFGRYGFSPLGLDGSTELTTSLSSLIDYGKGYGELLRSAKLIWSPNGKYLVPLIPLGGEELADKDIQNLLGELIDLASQTTLRPLLIAENPRSVSPELRRSLSWQAFIGADQIAYARDRYAMAQLPGMPSRIPIGLSVDSVAEESRILNSFSYEPTEEARSKRQAISDDVASYERFLEGLTDGS